MLSPHLGRFGTGQSSETIMITLSDEARQDLTDFFKNKETAPIRVQLAPGGCMGPRLSLDLDRQLPSDSVAEVDGLVFVMDKNLLAQVGDVTIDVDYTGFKISSQRAPSGDCSGGDCGSCSGASGGTICPF